MKTSYSRAQVLLHWSVAVLILVSFFSHEAMVEAWEAWRRDGVKAGGAGTLVHVLAGVTVLSLVLWRILLRLRRSAPALPPSTSPAIRIAAKATHAAIYLLLVAIPVTGMAAWMGGVKQAAAVHQPLFLILMLLVLGHVVAALWHQFVLKDGLMARITRPEGS